MSEDLSNEVRGLWAEVDRLRTFIRSLEYAGKDVVYYDGATADCCPSCAWFKPDAILYSEDDKKCVGHAPDCELVAMLVPRTTSAPTGEKR